MSEDFDFAKWCGSNGFTAKTSGKLKQQDFAVTEALTSLDKRDIDELGLTNGKRSCFSRRSLVCDRKCLRLLSLVVYLLALSDLTLLTCGQFLSRPGFVRVMENLESHVS